MACHRAGDFAAAAQHYEAVLAQAPENIDALNLAGALAAQCGDPGRGVLLLTQAGLLAPENPDIIYNLGQALRGVGRLVEAAEAYRHCRRLNPHYRPAGLNLATTLLELDAPGEAIAVVEADLTLWPDDARLIATGGQALAALDRPEDAEQAYRAALALQPDNVAARANLVDLLADLDQLEAAEGLARETLALGLAHPVLHNNFGRVLILGGRNREAAEQFRAAIALDPDYANAWMNLGMALLALGAFAEGWAAYEWRWRSRICGPGQRVGVRWSLASPQHTPVLLFGEQGFGDVLQFCRFAPYLAENGWRVQLAVPAPLVRLLAYSFAPAGVIVFADGDDPFAADRPMPGSDCPLMSLPWALGMNDLARIPHQPYLSVPAAARARAAARLAETTTPGTRLRVGLVWSGNPRTEQRPARLLSARRSMRLEPFAPLAAVPGVALHALQIGAGSEGLDAPPFPIVDHRGFIGDFLDTAALAAELDLVVTVDTSVAHLAGGLGRPVWVLSRYDACWRWLEGRNDSPWYPSLRLFRQPARGDWASVIADIVQALEVAVQTQEPTFFS